MKRIFIALIAAITLMIPASVTFAASPAPTIVSERIVYTRNRTTEAVAIRTSNPTYFEMLYCEGTSIPSTPTTETCRWIMDEDWGSGYDTRNTVLMTNLAPFTFYTYRIQLIAEDGQAVVTQHTFFNR